MTPRWLKLWRDVRAERGRVALMIAAIAVSLSGLGTILGARAVLTRDVALNYLGTHPAEATFELPGGVERALVDRVRALPGVEDAEAREVLVARAQTSQGWRRMLLFVIDDFERVRLNRFRPERGAARPANGELLMERSSVQVVNGALGQPLVIELPGGAPTSLTLSGIVHDPGLAPGWQEGCGYAYVTRETVRSLGGSDQLGELRVAFTSDARAEIEARSSALAQWLRADGHAVTEVKVPPPGQHPHQRQMETVMVMLLAFAVMAVVLAGVLVANGLSTLLARQVREIAVMKTLGATSAQIAALYSALVAALGLVSALLALPVMTLGTAGMARAISQLLNLELSSVTPPPLGVAIVLTTGVLVPLLLAAPTVWSAARRTIHAALDGGAVVEASSSWRARLPHFARGALRRPARLALAVGLLATGGAMAITALQVRGGWEANVAKVFTTRSYDVDVTLVRAAERQQVISALRGVSGVRDVEAWSLATATFSNGGVPELSRTYPDGGHGSFIALGVPASTGLVHFPLRAGRWLQPDDRGTRALVLNHSAAARRPGLRVGDEVELSFDGTPTKWKLVGIVEEIGASAVAWVSDADFEAQTGVHGARSVRLATSASSTEERLAVMEQLGGALRQAGFATESVLPLSELRTAMGDHIEVLVRLLLALAAVFSAVGLLGLVSTLGASVVERTREIGILKTLGATPGRIMRDLLLESLTTAALSFVVAIPLAAALTSLVGGVVGQLGFLAPLPFTPSAPATIGWVLIASLGTIAATAWPARAAGKLVVREALGRT